MLASACAGCFMQGRKSFDAEIAGQRLQRHQRAADHRDEIAPRDEEEEAAMEENEPPACCRVRRVFGLRWRRLFVCGGPLYVPEIGI